MKDKEKQIEEMAKVMYGYICKDKPCEKCDYHQDSKILAPYCEYYLKAKDLYNADYRKLPEDSVVLSKEEYKKLRSLYDCEQGSYMTSSIGNLPLTVEGLRKAVDEITRLNRVESELQELNAKYYNEAKDLRRELKQVSKETAENLFNTIIQALEERKDRIRAFYGVDESVGIDIAIKTVQELAKQSEVEIKE